MTLIGHLTGSLCREAEDRPRQCERTASLGRGLPAELREVCAGRGSYCSALCFILTLLCRGICDLCYQYASNYFFLMTKMHSLRASEELISIAWRIACICLLLEITTNIFSLLLNLRMFKLFSGEAQAPDSWLAYLAGFPGLLNCIKTLHYLISDADM